MVRTKFYISLLLFVICFGSIGCNPGIVEFPPTSVTDMSTYFWNGKMSPAVFRDVDSSGTVKSTFNLSFLDTSGQSSFAVYERNGSLSEVLTCTSKSDSVTVTGLSTHSVLPLPDGYSVKPKVTLIPKNTTPLSIRHILAITSATIVATTDGGAYYSTDSGNTWNDISASLGNGRDTITALGYMGSIVVAGTSQGKVYISTSYGQAWSSSLIKPFNDPILALTIDPITSTLYLSVRNTVYKLDINTNFSIASLGTTNEPLTSLASSFDGTGILVGGSNGNKGLWYDIDTGTVWQIIQNGPPLDASIISLLSTTNGFYCSTASSVYYSRYGTSQWNPILSLPKVILGFDLRNGVVIAASSNDSIVRISDSLRTLKAFAPSLPKNLTLNDISISYPNYFAATTTGIYKLALGQSWKPVLGNGNNLPPDTLKSPGEVTLLHSITGDSSWDADTLVNTKNVSFPITARLIDHLSSITMPDSTSYPDVIEVQYSPGPGNQTGGPASCQIFYAKNVGPIIIREIYGNAVLRRIYRWKN